MSQPSPEGVNYVHFAMIYIDRDGNLCQRASDSIAESRQTILSPRVTGEFLRAVAMSRESQTQYKSSNEALLPCSQGSHLDEYSPAQSQGGLVAYSGMSMGSEQMQDPVRLDVPIQQPMWSSPNGFWPTETRPRRKNFGGRSFNLTSHQTVSISVKERDFLRLYYEKVFQNLQQTNCRVIAKAYIKLVEPRKQVNYPYNGRKIVEGRTRQLDPEATKPPWWPLGVSHREPDHLPKVERIRLLVHILCELHESHAITTIRLKECDQPIRRQILPVDRLQILDEAYRVREKEQEFLDGISDGEQPVLIARTNLPQPTEDSSSGQSSPTASDPIRNIARSDSSDDSPCIGPSQVIPVDPSRGPGYNPSDLYCSTMQLGPNISYQPVETPPTLSTSPSESKRKRESTEMHLVDRTRHFDAANYPYPGDSSVQPTRMEFFAHNMPQTACLPITQSLAESSSTEPMIPYANPYFFNY
ncbi:hypothetical protein N7457_007559 [Penicillium paradoxum]|uniref:uncharacterized protein n=1 Tax=Penicillium paradoxum TaxID=176176 RepID=UPI002547109B|nr:uncharacterized protein N7457_007559 [Penicillium paradoxum]KAJ5779839.1 hypothetical protein N7457_007559 [Penicillium paradoxum]